MLRHLWLYQPPLQAAIETSIQTQSVAIYMYMQAGHSAVEGLTPLYNELWGNFPKQA